jgi:hypothetical protein
MKSGHCAKLSAIARAMAARGDAQVLTHEDAANDPSKRPPLDPANEALLRRAYAMTAFPAHQISFETVISTASYAVALINIAAHLRETGRL